MKLNNKGLSVIEIVLTFTLIMIMVIGLINIVMSFRDKASISLEKLDMDTFKNTLTKDIQDDILKYGVKEINTDGECNTIQGLDKCINIVFQDGSERIFGTSYIDANNLDSVQNKYLYYDGEKYPLRDTLPDTIPSGRSVLDFQSIVIEDNNILSVSSTVLEDGTVIYIYSIDVYISHIDFDEDFGIHIVATTDNDLGTGSTGGSTEVEKTSDNTIQVITASYNEKLWQYKKDITKIIIKNELEPMEELQKFNISESGEGNIIAYYDPDTTIAYIQGDGKIYANSDSSYLFSGFTQLTEIEGVSLLDTSEVANMSGMFSGCVALTELDLNSWNTSKVTNMQVMFNSCTKLENLYINEWNVSNVKNMGNMFISCSNLNNLNISNWKTSNVENMQMMFYRCLALTNLDLNGWDVSNVTNMQQMFSTCQALTDVNLNNWIFLKETNMSGMFDGCSNLKNVYIDNWTFSTGMTTAGMFQGCSNLTLTINITSTNIKNYTNMFTAAARDSGQITINYTEETSDLVDDMIKYSTTCNVKKGTLIN